MPPITSLARLPRRALIKRVSTTGNNGKEAVALVIAVTPPSGSHDGAAQAFSIATARFAHTASLAAAATGATGPSPIMTNSSTTQGAVSQTPPPQKSSRSLHSSTSVSKPALAANTSVLPMSDSSFTVPPHPGVMSPPRAAVPALSALPTGHIVRSLMTTTISSSPTLLPPSLSIMSVLANSNSALLNPDRNPIMRWALKSTFYRQFCAGETGSEVSQTAQQLRSLGFSGIILNYAREIVLPKEAKESALEITSREERDRCVADEVIPWVTGQMETVRFAQPGDFVAVKFSGAGRVALSALARRDSPPDEIEGPLNAICSVAASRGVRLMFDAEQFSLQGGIDDWTMDMMRRYNKDPNAPVIYNTYQCYLKSTPANLSAHLAQAQKEGFTLGAKLVRGAYMGHDRRELMWDTKAETDNCFDNVSTALLRREWGATLNGSGEFPDVGVCLATHNAESVRLARKIFENGTKTDLSIAQLQGMADEVSCELLTPAGEEASTAPKAKAFKYLTWGTTGECMKYLLRRAQENKDAVQRTRDTRDAMKSELVRRVKGMFGFA